MKQENEIAKKAREIISEIKEDELKTKEATSFSLKVESLNNVLSDFAPLDNPIIAEEFASILDNHYLSLNKNKKIKIYINGLTNEELDILSKAKKHYYKARIYNAYQDLKHNNNSAISFMGIGIVILCIMITLSSLDYISFDDVIKEVLDIIAWVFVWEGTQLLFMERHKLRQQLIKEIRLQNAIFINKNEE